MLNRIKYFIFKDNSISKNISRNLSWLYQYKQKISESEPQTLSSGAFWVHFQTLFLMCFWTYIKLSFQWGVTRLYFKKLIICSFFVQTSRIPVARGTLKNGPTKKIFVQKLFLSPMTTFRNAQKKLIFTLPPKKGCKWKKRLGKQNFKKGGHVD